MIAVVDYRLGNPGSIRSMLERLGAACSITSDPQTITTADHIILPGVGAFDSGMSNLALCGLIEPLSVAALERRKPVLGICLGMQLMTRGSEEGSLPGLGWVGAETKRFRFPNSGNSLRVPHMGWSVAVPAKVSPLWRRVPDPAQFYFVHSFHVCCDSEADVAATTEYGGLFTSAFAVGNLYGVQFHPEKSHRFGMALLKSFAEIS